MAPLGEAQNILVTLISSLSLDAVQTKALYLKSSVTHAIQCFGFCCPRCTSRSYNKPKK